MLLRLRVQSVCMIYPIRTCRPIRKKVNAADITMDLNGNPNVYMYSTLQLDMHMNVTCLADWQQCRYLMCVASRSTTATTLANHISYETATYMMFQWNIPRFRNWDVLLYHIATAGISTGYAYVLACYLITKMLILNAQTKPIALVSGMPCSPKTCYTQVPANKAHLPPVSSTFLASDTTSEKRGSSSIHCACGAGRSRVAR